MPSVRHTGSGLILSQLRRPGSGPCTAARGGFYGPPAAAPSELPVCAGALSATAALRGTRPLWRARAVPGHAAQAGGGFGKVLLTIVGVLVGLFVLLVIIGSLLPDEEGGTVAPVGSTAQGIVSGPVITDRVNQETQEPLTAPKLFLPPTTDQIYAAVNINVRAGQRLGARWYYEGRHQAHLDTTLDIPDNFRGWAAFNIGNGGQPWPKGSYRVEVLLDGQKQVETSFSVK